MTTRSLSIAAAAGLLVTAAMLPHQAAALPGLAETQAGPSLVQQVGNKYNRRYYRDNGSYVRAPFTEVDTRRGTWVAAPFARVYSGRRGTWVRAPFVDLWVPR
ncbi:MAG TPA: hypothetical protein VLD66_10250 [Methyloceanibacter sp.]|jgi:hypothetical protein|nr:hypothetical protein [Methyloceanibacter sp.]